MDKLTYTAVLELVPLMQIPGVKKVGVMVLSFWGDYVQYYKPKIWTKISLPYTYHFS